MFSFCMALGNVDFEDNDSGEGSIITTPETLETAAELLQSHGKLALRRKRAGSGVFAQIAANALREVNEGVSAQPELRTSSGT